MSCKYYILITCVILPACSAVRSKDAATNNATPSVRQIASLDNNGEPVDDSFDPKLETYFGGDAGTEQKANDKVAAIIKDFIDAQKAVRQQMDSSNLQSLEAQRIFNDLPKHDYATRDVHRKTNGCFKAQLDISSNLKQSLNRRISAVERQAPGLTPVSDDAELGVFAPGKTYDAVVRLSNGNPGNNPDRVPDARGFAVKLLPQGTLNDGLLEDMRATDLNQATKLDILSINFPTFFVNDPVKYAALNQGALHASKDFTNYLAGQAEQFLAVFVSAGFTSLERKLALAVNGSVIYSPLYQQYYSMVPSRLGAQGVQRAVKYSWEPVACNDDVQAAFESERGTQWPAWSNDRSYAFPPHSPSAVKSFPDDYLRQHVKDRLSQGDFCFNLYVQLYQDDVSTNIEDSTDIWLSSEAERSWWTNKIVPSALEWPLSLNNQESRAAYLNRLAQKQISPRIFAARLTIKQLQALELSNPGANNSKLCEDLSFNPWNGNIAYHKPLGIVSRMKRKVYNASRRERHELNGIDDKGIERNQ